MMEYCFGVRWGRVTKEQRVKLDAIAEAHGVTFLEYSEVDGSGARSWFAGPNRGQPFDGQLSDAVAADVEARGVWQ